MPSLRDSLSFSAPTRHLRAGLSHTAPAGLVLQGIHFTLCPIPARTGTQRAANPS